LPAGLLAAIAACLPRPRLACRAAAVIFMGVLLHQPHAKAAPSVEYPGVVRDYQIEFPRDEGSHPDFRTEWWYITGWLETESGAPLGFQITFFRTRPGVDEENPSRFAARQLLFAHVAISDPKRGALLRDERAAREGFGLAEAKQDVLDVRIDDWFLRRVGERCRASIAGREFTAELEFIPTQPVLLQGEGEGGYSQKGPQPASASHYYSLPQLATRGRIVIDGRELRIVEGVAWFDHEWSSAFMDEAASGWDWVGLNLEEGGALMAFRMRDEHGGKHWAAATLRGSSGGGRRVFAPEEIDWTALRYWRSTRTGVRYPIEWKIVVGGRTMVLKPLMDDQENDARGSTGTLYWEGAVRAFDERGRQIGRGYLELTGYGQRLRF
jgi:predicted secreted hydrolase